MFNFAGIRRLCYLLLVVFITNSKGQDPCLHDQLFDFEPAIPGQESCFIPSAGGLVNYSTDPSKVKHGESSLEWTATTASNLRLKSPNFTIPNAWLRHGGLTVWIYMPSPSPGVKLGVAFKHSSAIVAQFEADLNFKGWRGIWVKFQECKLFTNLANPTTVIDEVDFVLNNASTIYIDVLEFKESIVKQSRDKIVPPITVSGLYNLRYYWQQTYKWSNQPIPSSPSTIDPDKKKSFDHIKSRLKNYYCDETKVTSSFQDGSFLKQRWDTLLGSIEKAHVDYDMLAFHKGKIVSPPLFCRNNNLGTKFGDIFKHILLPLALEYHIMSRKAEVTDAANKQLSNLNAKSRSRVLKAKRAIAGGNRNMQRRFTGYLPATRLLTQLQVEGAINVLNLYRLRKINKLLDFVEEQGFADGSGLGSLDHEMNRDGSGFIHTLFLISDSLSVCSNKSRLQNLIKTAKWYNDFGEIYQKPKFEFKGTTADRMITLMLFRLIIVLVMPSDDDDEIKAKIRDMDALVSWMNNALSVNEGLGGVIKPDFTGFHHKAFYASAYVPEALHTAAFVQYLLGGTAFALSSSSTYNIRRGLETLRIIAVKYSTPNSVNGRFPNYFNKALIKAVLPGFAYASVSYPSTLPSTVPRGISVGSVNQAMAQMFLRLYNDPCVDDYKGDGRQDKCKYYFNSLGSLDIMEAVKTVASSQGMSAESSPEGHWSKNFAALSIHRRKDWAVTVKGFNRFVWDFEGSVNENVYGLFASHGALLIANSEADLEVHDVENGWDWAKIPGTTTIDMRIDMGNSRIDDLKIGKGRFYNKCGLAGGLTFKGLMNLKNGLFGMNFRQPDYGFSTGDWRKEIDFQFKKSVFSFENLLVCLGSDIKAQRARGSVTQTTLFQDKLKASSFIKVDGVQKNQVKQYNHVPSTSTNYTTLSDTKGNFYYVPDPSKSMLKVTVGIQSSKSDDGNRSTFGSYGTAWFKHSSSHPKYQYAVLIPTTSYHEPLTDLATDQETAGSEVYKVLKHDSTAHVVQFLKSPKSWELLRSPFTGYVIFMGGGQLPADGPVAKVSKRCLVMAQATSESIYFSISDPDLDFALKRGTSYPTNSNDVGEHLLYKSTSKRRFRKVTLRNRVKAIAIIKVHGAPDGYTPFVTIGRSGRSVYFRNLKNGFSVEVKLTK